MEPITYLQAIILGALQGIAEPFPISSLGHAVILPSLLGWNIHQNDNFFLAFLVATHCATALVLFLFFLDDWKRIFHGFVRSLRGQATPRDADARLAWVILVGTIPAGILGVALEHKLRDLFASPTTAAIFLTINGILLLAFERFSRAPGVRDGGSGLGLAIVATVAEAHGGSAHAANRPAGGADVWIVIPLSSRVNREPA